MSVIFNSDMDLGNEVYKKHFFKVAQCSLAMFKINITAFVKQNSVSLQSLCSNNVSNSGEEACYLNIARRNSLKDF